MLPDRDTMKSIKHLQGSNRLQSVGFMFVGAMSGFCGFGFAGFLGIFKYKTSLAQTGLDLKGDPFPSGCNFHPMTVSEMVCNPSSDEGKVWFAFCMIGAICILCSAYPWALQNVYIGTHLTLPGTSVPVIFLRQFLPPIGMMLVCCITVTQGQRNFTQRIAADIHTFGAVLMIAGYIGFEVHALWFSEIVRISPRERRVRKIAIIVCGICAIGFQGCGVALSKLGTCGASCSCGSDALFTQTCTDQWVVPTLTNVTDAKLLGHLASFQQAGAANEIHATLLANTATGYVLFLKQVNYWCEVFAGLAMLFSHLVILYYCQERKLDLDEDLPEIRITGYQKLDDEQ
eukprot:TRINITY_DN58133_c0_g1_i1.p1 TRINITY_DN58133_c0_g1~~TRINITY_DN58133_c0_g1_i1.p1  ORF type:complete len:344 (-),score=39.91 TRINITY_DN58133_c0_g1_i1:99-1130(-)